MQVTEKTKLHTSAFIAPAIAITSYVLQPEVLNVLPEKYSKIGYAAAGLFALFAPQLLKRTPPTE